MEVTRIIQGLATGLGLMLACSARADLTVDVIGPTDVTFEGLFQADKNYFNNDFDRVDRRSLTAAERSSQTLVDDAGMRRAELIFKGRTVMTDWSVAYEARANRWLDVYFRQKFGSFSNWRLGQFKQNNSLEELAATRHNDFVAKASTTSAFAIARRLGAEVATGGDPWTLTGSIFNREITNNGQKSDGYSVRGTFAPIMQVVAPDNDADNVLHLGVSLVGFDPSKNVQRISLRPEADLANIRLIDTLNLTDATDARQLGLEAMWLYGPVKLSAEYVDANYQRSANPDYNADSWYVSGVYNLTGEKFRYKTGIYTVPIPAAEVGMWQLGARYSRINANDGLVKGGEQDVATLGVNWYWRLNFKFMLNYSAVKSERGAFINDPNVLELRAQMTL
jgi:phosphate-selective porin OprO and OprP